jgi:hypothetical protein
MKMTKAANNFHAARVTWLVISGARMFGAMALIHIGHVRLHVRVETVSTVTLRPILHSRHLKVAG